MGVSADLILISNLPVRVAGEALARPPGLCRWEAQLRGGISGHSLCVTRPVQGPALSRVGSQVPDLNWGLSLQNLGAHVSLVLLLSLGLRDGHVIVFQRLLGLRLRTQLGLKPKSERGVCMGFKC